MNENQCNCENVSSKKDTLKDTLREKLGEIKGRLVEIDKLSCEIGSKTLMPRLWKNENRMIKCEVVQTQPETEPSIEDFINLIDGQTKDIMRKLIDIDGLI